MDEILVAVFFDALGHFSPASALLVLMHMHINYDQWTM